MKLYRISYTGKNTFDAGSNTGFKFASSKREAQRTARENPNDYETEIDMINVDMNKAGIIRALNVYAGHPDNG